MSSDEEFACIAVVVWHALLSIHEDHSFLFELVHHCSFFGAWVVQSAEVINEMFHVGFPVTESALWERNLHVVFEPEHHMLLPWLDKFDFAWLLTPDSPIV